MGFLIRKCNAEVLYSIQDVVEGQIVSCLLARSGR